MYQGESLIYAQYLLKNAPNAKIGVIYQNDDYGQDYLDGLTKGLGSKAAEMIVDKESNDVGAPDLNSQILKLKNCRRRHAVRVRNAVARDQSASSRRSRAAGTRRSI